MDPQANVGTVIPLAERTDIHKSCKALETVVNSFNDFCQASDAVVQTRKRLAKALREMAGMKATGELPGTVSST
jgi:hypothetical protein